MNLLNVRILNSKQVLFQSPAQSVSSANSKGKFDILPEHANFITLIKDADLIIKDQNNQAKKFHFEQAILYQSRNMVNIYTDISLPT